jgi:RNA polymerase sigma factor (sigma-70 family)
MGSDAAELASQRTVEAVWRIEAARLIGGLTRLVRDVGLAEDLAQDALVAALERWPQSGVPDNPGAWLAAAARYRAIDLVRRRDRFERRREELVRSVGLQLAIDSAELERAVEDRVEDDVLRLMFMCCHPLLGADARVALTLRMLGGLTTAEIARAFLASEATVAQRIVRAKRTLGDAEVAFEVPSRDELALRLDSVLEVIYLIFNEGYAATAGEDWMRPALCEEALRLGRILAVLMPRAPEAHGLVALMELQASRSRARLGPRGEPVLLAEQDRARWDPLLIRRGLAALDRAEELSGELGPYTLQAAIAAAHARARRAQDTDWARIVALYGALARVAPSPVVELNRAVAIAMRDGPLAALELVDRLADEPALAGYHLLPAVRGDLLARLDRRREASAEFERAAALTVNARERALLLERAAACAAEGASSDAARATVARSSAPTYDHGDASDARADRPARRGARRRPRA